jgi:membrane associated rhomboid family serine protease
MFRHTQGVALKGVLLFLTSETAMRYPRYPYSRSSFYGYFPTGVKWLLISNVAMFLLMYISSRTGFGSGFLLLALAPRAVVYHLAVWQLFTYLFLHGGIGHLLFNMLSLWMFGSPLEQAWGTRRFLKYYFICGVGAGFCDVAVNAALGHWGTRTIGASGAIYGLLLAFGVLYPNQTVLMNFLFPIKAKYLVMIYGAIALLSALGENSGVSNIAHLGGMLFGYIYLKAKWPGVGFNFAQMNASYNQWKLERAKRKFQVYMRKQGRGGGPWVN